jgi:hypothetical protein
MLLNIEHVIFINLYVSIKSKSIPLMVLFNFLKFYHDKVYIHLDRSNNTKHIVNYTPLYERDSYTHVSNFTSNQFYFACMIYFDFICTFILLMLSGDIESNPGLSSQSTSISCLFKYCYQYCYSDSPCSIFNNILAFTLVALL